MSETIVKDNPKWGFERSDGRTTLLLTCVGRRVSLLEAFARAAKALELEVYLCGTDTTKLSPAFQICDEGIEVCPITSPGYVSQLLSVVKERGIRLLVPTIDSDLPVLAKNRTAFENLGCRVLVSDANVIDICRDKRKTAGFLKEHGFDVPATCSVAETLGRDQQGRLTWPCFLKPWDGSAGRGGTVVHDRQELRFYADRIPHVICQELIEGDEYTCDVYVDFERRVRCVVPRLRLEVRRGEVSKAQVVKAPEIMSQAARLVETLGAGPGVITVQLFRRRDGRLTFIEVNPRFGGGVPLSIRAGADFPRWILQELMGQRPEIGFDAFQDDLTMLRYDAEVWLAGATEPKPCMARV